MRIRSLLALLAGVSVGALGTVFFLLPEPPETRRSGTGDDSFSLRAREPVEPLARPATADAQGDGTREEVPVATGPARAAGAPALRPVASLHVEVREPDGREAAAVSLRLASHPGPHLEGLAVEDDRRVRAGAKTDERGRATFASVPVGPYVLTAQSVDRRRARQELALTLDRSEVRVQLPELAEPGDLLVRVVDPDGARLEKVRVEIYGGVVGAASPAVASSPALAGESGAEGVARFQDVEYEGGVIVARAPDGRSGMARVRLTSGLEPEQRRDGIVVTVSHPGSLEGELTGLPADRYLDARVLAFALDNDHPHLTTHGALFSTPVVGGAYRFEALPAGRWTLALADPGGARLVLPKADFAGPIENSADPIEVEVEPGAASVRDLEVAEGGGIEGRVITETGGPVAGALVRETYGPRTSNFPDGFVLRGVNVWRFDTRSRAPGDHPVTHVATRTDVAGSYRLTGLQPGAHRIEVLAPGLSYDRREAVAVEDGQRTSLEHVLEPAGVLQGVQPRAGYVGLTKDGEDDPLMIAILPQDGRFTFAGLAAGAYVISQFHSDATIAPAPLATAEVRAGQTTWIDLSRAERPVHITGRVLDARGAVAGARVRLYPESRTTDASGRFEFQSSFPLTESVPLQVLRDGVETGYAFPGMPALASSWERDLVLGGETLRLRTFDEGGTPVPARLEIFAASLAEGDVETIRFEPLFVGERGEREVSGILPGEYLIRARFDNGSETQTAVLVPSPQDVELRMPPSGDIAVILRAPEGELASGRWVSVTTWTEIPAASPDREPVREPVVRWDETDFEGRARFRGVTAGEVLIEVRASRGFSSFGQNAVASERLELAPHGTSTVEIALPSR